MHRTFLLLPALAAASPAFAEDDAIVVVGRGLIAPETTATSCVFLSQDDLRATSASGRIEDSLLAISGLQEFRRSDSRSANPTAQGLTMRGLGGNASSRTVVLLDGVPMADPFFGSVPLSALSPERLASVQVTRGGGSVINGAGAVAGTIELTSAGATELGRLGASAMADDRGETTLSGTLAPKLGNGFAVVSARWDRGAGFWTTPLAQRVPASVKARYDSWSAGLRGVAMLTSDTELQFRALLFEDRRTLRFAGADSSASGQDASIRMVHRGRWQVDALAYVQARDFSNVVISSTTFRKTLDQYGTPATGLGGRLELRPPVGEGKALRLGADWRLASGRTQETAFNATSGAVTARRIAGGRQSDVGLFLEGDWKLGALTLTAGGRADRWSQSAGMFREANASGTIITDNAFPNRSGWQGSFRGGAVFKPAEGLSLRAAAYSAMRLPTLNELYRPFTVFPVITRANAALANEALQGFEAGLDWLPAEGISLSLTTFDNRVKHAVANVTLAANLRERRNLDAVRSRGVEAEAYVRLGTVSLRGSLAWNDAQVEASGTSAALDGKRPAQTAQLAASTTLAWKPRKGWDFALTLRHTGAQFEDDLESDLLPAATVLSATAEVPMGARFALVLRAENITDTKVITRNQAGSMDLAAPRTIWAGVRVNLP